MLSVNKVDGIDAGNELIEKCEKLLKTRKTSKGQKLFKSENSKSKILFKSRKLAKSEKKSLKSEILSNFNGKDNGPSFLTRKPMAAFNRLRLAFTKAPILQHFNQKCHIWIETNILSYAISGMLS